MAQKVLGCWLLEFQVFTFRPISIIFYEPFMLALRDNLRNEKPLFNRKIARFGSGSILDKNVQIYFTIHILSLIIEQRMTLPMCRHLFAHF